jgi:hypothetical protein
MILCVCVCVCVGRRAVIQLCWREHTIRILQSPQLGFHIGRRKSLRSRDAAAAAGPQNLGESQINISSRGFECGTCKYTKMTENKLCWIWFSALCFERDGYAFSANCSARYDLGASRGSWFKLELRLDDFSVRKFSLHQWTQNWCFSRNSSIFNYTAT